MSSQNGRQGSLSVSMTIDEIGLLERLLRAAKSVQQESAGCTPAEMLQARYLSKTLTDSEYSYDKDDDDHDFTIPETPASNVQQQSQASSRRHRYSVAKHVSNPHNGKSMNSTRPHAAVEKRYRSTINDKIHELQKRIPDDFEEHEQTSRGQGATKGVTLDRAARYIHHLMKTYEDDENNCRRIRASAERWLGDSNHSTRDDVGRY